MDKHAVRYKNVFDVRKEERGRRKVRDGSRRVVCGSVVPPSSFLIPPSEPLARCFR
jgi:hypothetical protein